MHIQYTEKQIKDGLDIKTGRRAFLVLYVFVNVNPSKSINDSKAQVSFLKT